MLNVLLKQQKDSKNIVSPSATDFRRSPMCYCGSIENERKEESNNSAHIKNSEQLHSVCNIYNKQQILSFIPQVI